MSGRQAIERIARLRVTASVCISGDCPTIYAIDESPDEVAIQGFVINASAPAGEAIVRIPRSLLDQAVLSGNG